MYLGQYKVPHNRPKSTRSVGAQGCPLVRLSFPSPGITNCSIGITNYKVFTKAITFGLFKMFQLNWVKGRISSPMK